MSIRTTILLHAGFVIVAALALWIFVFPYRPDKAVADALGAGLIADTALLFGDLYRWWK